MTIHPRHVPVELAARKIAAAITDAAIEFELTPAETLMILNEAMAVRLKGELEREHEKNAKKRGPA